MKKSELKALIQEVIRETIPDYDKTKGIGAYPNIVNAIRDLAHDVRKLQSARDSVEELEALKLLEEDSRKLAIFIKKTLDGVNNTFPTNPTQ